MMKNHLRIRLFAFLGIFLLTGLGIRAQETAAAPLRVLTIGNSFAYDAVRFLPELARANGKTLLLFRANPGGCSLEKHAGWVKAFEKNPEDPNGRPYPTAFLPPRNEPGKKYSLSEALAAEPWDYVTIQQVSDNSFKPETFEPHAKILVETIRRFAPQAEIVIHQTWAYREDYPGFANGEFTQKKMYDGLVAAYDKLAQTYQLRIIPVGEAMQAARATPRWTFVYPDPAFDYAHPPAGKLPVQTGSLNMGWLWAEPKGEPKRLILDHKHANTAGCYLAGSVWYEFLTKEDVRPNRFHPQDLTDEDALLLRQIAHDSVAKRVAASP